MSRKSRFKDAANQFGTAVGNILAEFLVIVSEKFPEQAVDEKVELVQSSDADQIKELVNMEFDVIVAKSDAAKAMYALLAFITEGGREEHPGRYEKLHKEKTETMLKYTTLIKRYNAKADTTDSSVFEGEGGPVSHISVSEDLLEKDREATDITVMPTPKPKGERVTRANYGVYRDLAGNTCVYTPYVNDGMPESTRQNWVTLSVTGGKEVRVSRNKFREEVKQGRLLWVSPGTIKKVTKAPPKTIRSVRPKYGVYISDKCDVVVVSRSHTNLARYTVLKDEEHIGASAHEVESMINDFEMILENPDDMYSVSAELLGEGRHAFHTDAGVVVRTQVAPVPGSNVIDISYKREGDDNAIYTTLSDSESAATLVCSLLGVEKALPKKRGRQLRIANKIFIHPVTLDVLKVKSVPKDDRRSNTTVLINGDQVYYHSLAKKFPGLREGEYIERTDLNTGVTYDPKVPRWAFFNPNNGMAFVMLVSDTGEVTVRTRTPKDTKAEERVFADIEAANRYLDPFFPYTEEKNKEGGNR